MARQFDQFLSALFVPEELIELRFIESCLSQGKKQSRAVRAAEWLQRADVIAMHASFTAFARRTRANIYFEVCPRPRHGDAHDGSIGTVRCLWCDIDRIGVDEARNRWSVAGIPQPSIVVSSGSGVHGYWLLDRDFKSPEEHLRLRAMLPCFDESLGGDHVRNISRIMRLPGTFNYKDARNGRPPQPCKLCQCDPDRRFPLEAFSPWFEQAQRHLVGSTPTPRVATTARISAGRGGPRDAEVAELVGRLDVPSRDRSRRDFAVVCDLLRLGLSKDEIWEVVSGSSKFETAGRPYFELTITNTERTVGLKGTTTSRSRTSV